MWTSACLRSTVSIVLEAQTEDLFLTVSLSFYWSCCVILIWDLSIRLLTCCHLSPFIPDLDFWVESLQRIHPCLRLSMDKGTPLPACSKVGVYQQSTKYHETSDFEVITMDVQDPMLVRFVFCFPHVMQLQICGCFWDISGPNEYIPIVAFQHILHNQS